MSVRNKNIGLTLLFLLLLCFNAKAQNDKEVQLLDNVLEILQKRYNYYFTRNIGDIENIYLPLPPEDLSAEEAIDWLKEQARLLEQQTGIKINIKKRDNSITISVTGKDIFSVCGYIKDEETGEPLAEAHIYAENDESKGVGSDENGYFELAVNHKNGEIVMSYLGRKTLSLPFSFFEKEDCSDIYLEPEAIIINVVTPTGLRHIPYIEGVDEIREGFYEGTNPDRLGFRVPVPFSDPQSVSENFLNMSMWGGGHDQLRFWWDGIKIYKPGTIFGLSSIFSPWIAPKISVKKYGMDIGYPGGVSGNIVTETDTVVNRNVKGNIGISFTGMDGFLDIPVFEGASVQISTVKSIGGFVKTSTYKEYSHGITRGSTIREADKNLDYSIVAIRGLYNPGDKEKIRVNFINVIDKLIFNENTDEISRSGSLTQRNTAAGGMYEKTWNDALKTTSQFYVTDWEFGGMQHEYNTTRINNNRVLETGITLNALYKFDERLSWLNGYGFVMTEVNNRFHSDNILFNSDEAVRTHSFYTQTDLTLDGQTRVRFGLRMVNIETFEKLLLEPRLVLIHRFSDCFTVEIQGEFRHQSIFQGISSNDEFLGIDPRRWYVSDETIYRFIKSRQLVLGGIYRKNEWLISAELYYKYVRGMTILSEQFNPEPVPAYTVGYRVSGVDISIEKKLSEDLHLRLGYFYMNKDDTFDRPARTSPGDIDMLSEGIFPSIFDAPHALNLNAFYTDRNFSASVDLNWHSGLPKERTVFIIDPLALPDNNNGPLSRNLFNNYFRIDASARYRFKKEEKPMADLSVSLWNLWSLIDRNNFVSNYYNIRNTETEKVLQPGLEAILNMTLRVYL